ncbi:hypothetical protein [Streptomyces sp. NBC_01718]|uniref:hypothetical protein n=1 Tax=Streptomyces sp. NBC_01718 TaxID=2975919 RepID=UPI00352C468B
MPVPTSAPPQKLAVAYQVALHLAAILIMIPQVTGRRREPVYWRSVLGWRRQSHPG